MAKLHSILDRVDKHLDNVNETGTMAKLNRTLDSLDETVIEVKGLLKDNRPGVKEMVASLVSTAKTLEKDIPDITKKLIATLDSAGKAVDSAVVSLDNIKELTANLKGLVSNNREQIDLVVNNITELSSNLKLVSRDVRRAPWKLLYKPKKDELRLQGVVDSAGAFASGAEQLNNVSLRLQKLIAAGGDTVLDNDDVKALLGELKTSFSNFQKAEKELWEKLDE